MLLSVSIVVLFSLFLRLVDGETVILIDGRDDTADCGKCQLGVVNGCQAAKPRLCVFAQREVARRCAHKRIGGREDRPRSFVWEVRSAVSNTTLMLVTHTTNQKCAIIVVKKGP